MRVRACLTPKDGFLQAYASRSECYTDCFEVSLTQSVELAEFIDAFYTTWLFRLERVVLTLAMRRRICDSDVKALAAEQVDRFAVWTVEERGPTEILMCDNQGLTRSYLAVEMLRVGQTRLIFGSAVVGRNGQSMGLMMRLLTPLHVLYSRGLLAAAARNLS